MSYKIVSLECLRVLEPVLVGCIGETAEVSQGGQAQSGGPSNKNVRDMHGDGKMPELQ